MKTVPELVKIPSKYGYYPIHAAAQEGLINTFHELLRFGAKPDMPTSNTNCRTPLRYAALNGHTEIVSILLQKGVNYLNVGNKNAPIKPMNSALTYGNWKVVELLLTYPHDNYYLKDRIALLNESQRMNLRFCSYFAWSMIPFAGPSIAVAKAV